MFCKFRIKSLKINEENLQEQVFFLFGVFRRGNKPPVLPGEDKKL